MHRGKVNSEVPQSLSLSSSMAAYLLKVFVCKINGRSPGEDDRQHKDDIELISEMLQNWLFDVYGQTWIIKILLKKLLNGWQRNIISDD